ncbi:MAG: hypothetical protein WA830_04280 [Candidatus Sulfotelmatobacter sp.]
MLLALFWAAACARPAGPQTDNGATRVDEHQVPFRDGDGNSRGNTGSGDSSNAPDNAKAETALPFHDRQSLPAGTLLTVRLKNPVSAENPDANVPFEAIVDEPVVIEGNQLVPRGATVAGRVESARASNLKRDRGYVRLALDSIHVAGLTLPIQTSSLFVSGNSGETRVPPAGTLQNDSDVTVVRLEKGRRLTFRLNESVYLAASQRAAANR